MPDKENWRQLVTDAVQKKHEAENAMARASRPSVLKAVMKELGWTNREMAETLGCHRSYVSKIVNGEPASAPTIEMLARVARMTR